MWPGRTSADRFSTTYTTKVLGIVSAEYSSTFPRNVWRGPTSSSTVAGVINGPGVDGPHFDKDKVRELSLDYGIKGREGNGALFWMVNVSGGMAMREEKRPFHRELCRS
jgi:hypothetical protein